MGSITGAAIGALLIGLAEQIGLVYFPTYGVVLTFVIMVVDARGAAAGDHGQCAHAPGRSAAGRAARRHRHARIHAGDRRARRRAAVVFPLVASPFVVFQLGAQTLILGMIALSLMVLAGYGGMVSLAQLTVAGVSGYSSPFSAPTAPACSASAGRGGSTFPSRS